MKQPECSGAAGQGVTDFALEIRGDFFFFEATSELEFKVDRWHSKAEGLAGRGTGMKKRVIQPEVTKEQM